MPDEEQFQMTVVQTTRKHHSAANGVSPEEHTHRGEREGGQHSHGENERRSASNASGQTHRHHRHYNDYGTVDLGALDEAKPSREVPAAAAEPTKGEIQREFFDKYDTALQRRYSTRNKSIVTRILMIAALLALVLILVAFGIGNLGNQAEETLPKPEVETNPIVTLDLG